MATVRFFTDEQGDLPDVCIKTGQATPDRVTLKLVYRPAWPILLLPLSALATVVGLVAGARRTQVAFPLTHDALRRYRQWWYRSLLVMLIAGIGFILAGATHQNYVACAMAVLFVAGAVAHWYIHMSLWCGFSVVNKDFTVVTIRRCHPNFLSAMRGLNDRS
jgi:hypothetical protein